MSAKTRQDESSSFALLPSCGIVESSTRCCRVLCVRWRLQLPRERAHRQNKNAMTISLQRETDVKKKKCREISSLRQRKNRKWNIMQPNGCILSHSMLRLASDSWWYHQRELSESLTRFQRDSEKLSALCCFRHKFFSLFLSSSPSGLFHFFAAIITIHTWDIDSSTHNSHFHIYVSKQAEFKIRHRASPMMQRCFVGCWVSLFFFAHT